MMPTRLSSIGFMRCGPTWTLTAQRTRAWTDLDLWFLVEGRGRFLGPDGPRALLPGTCLVMRGGEGYDLVPERPFRHFFAHFYLEGHGGPQGHRGAKALPPLYRQVARPDLLRTLLERALGASRRGDPSQAEAYFQAVMAEVWGDEGPVQADGGAVDRWGPSVMKLAQGIEENPRLPWAGLHRRLGLSRVHFGRVFAKHTGLSPRDYLRKCRIDSACRLLADSACSLTEVAREVGYGDLFHFSSHFKRHLGVSPSRWRRGDRAGV